MEMKPISLDQMCATLAAMKVTEEVPDQSGTIIAHRGEHPDHGETFLIACGGIGGIDAIMISEGVRFL